MTAAAHEPSTDAALDGSAVTRARAFAERAHGSQTDKRGRPYLTGHLVPIADALAPFGPAAQAAGYLHDVLEDTATTPDDLRAAGFSEEIVRAVVAVSKRSDDAPYTELIARAAADPLGVLVKLADNTWNLIGNPTLAKDDPDKARRMLDEKYLPGRRVLLGAADLDAVTVFDMELTLRLHLGRMEAESEAEESGHAP